MMRQQQGSTIIEVVIAMLILALLIVGLNTGVVSLIRSNIQSKELTSATAAGNELFEEFRRDDYDNMVSIGSSIDTVRERYVRDWQMDSDSIQTTTALQVRWPTETETHSIDLSTIIAKP